MPIYKWKGRTRSGTSKKGSFEAVNPAAAAAQLRSQGFVGFKVKEKPKSISETLTFLQPSIKTNDLVIFTRQFAVMIDAGLPLVTALGILGEQQPNPTFQRVLREVKADVEGGATFADSLKRHPKPFSDLYVNLVASGEVGGILDTILNRLAVQLEKAERLARQLRSAMVYPATVSAIAVVVIVLLLVKVIPVFEKMFADFGGSLPAPTQIVIDVSDFMQANILWMAAALGIAIHDRPAGSGAKFSGSVQDRPTPAPVAAIRCSHQESGRGSLYANPGNSCGERRSDSRLPRYCCQHGWKSGHRGRNFEGQRVDLRGQDDRRASSGLEGIPGDDGSDGGCWRGDGFHGNDADQGCRFLR